MSSITMITDYQYISIYALFTSDETIQQVNKLLHQYTQWLFNMEISFQQSHTCRQLTERYHISVFKSTTTTTRTQTVSQQDIARSVPALLGQLAERHMQCTMPSQWKPARSSL